MANKKMSETITENIFRDYYGSNTFIEKSAIPSEFGFISKNDTGNNGYPDFFKDMSLEGFYIVVEAKAVNHVDAQNEVIFYMENNQLTSDSIGIAVSGQTLEHLTVSYYLHDYESNNTKQLEIDSELLSVDNIVKIYKRSKYSDKLTNEFLQKTLESLNKQFHNEDIVRDTDRSLFFSGIMIALKDRTFRNTYKTIQAPSPEEASSSSAKLLEAHLLNESIVDAIARQLESKINNLSKEYNWKDKFSFIKTIDYSLLKYKTLIKNIEENIFIPFENEEKQDILGKAYKIFLKKAGKVDNKNIILTPDHIKCLMVKLARLQIDDVVLDTCAGSGGFLMEAMETLIALSKGNDKKIKKIKESQLIGFEIDSVLFALACSNMFLHGDGRTNLIFRSSLLNDGSQNLVDADDKELFQYIKKCKPTKIIINPPYENNKSIKFAMQAIQYLEPNGKLIIIMPTPTLSHNQKSGGLTEQLLRSAKLDFVIKMPENLFSEQSRTVNTSIFGFTKTPHRETDVVSYYNLSDDGFVSIQHKGRVDKLNKWSEKEDAIINCIMNNSASELCERRIIYNADGTLNCAGVRKARDSKYQTVKFGTLFKKAKGTLASEENDDSGEFDFITASKEWKKHSEYTNDEEALVFAVSASGSLGQSHYVNGKFIASNLCLILTPKNNEKYPINMRFYKTYFDTIREQLRADLADGTSKLTISPTDLMEYYIEYIPIDEQNSFYEEKIKPLDELQKSLNEAENNLICGVKEFFS